MNNPLPESLNEVILPLLFWRLSTFPLSWRMVSPARHRGDNTGENTWANTWTTQTMLPGSRDKWHQDIKSTPGAVLLMLNCSLIFLTSLLFFSTLSRHSHYCTHRYQWYKNFNWTASSEWFQSRLLMSQDMSMRRSKAVRVLGWGTNSHLMARQSLPR